MGSVSVYIDGFNLYYGMRDIFLSKQWCLYWLNLEALAVQLIKRNPVHNDGDSLGRIKYFTARVRGRSEKQRAKSRRQNTYLEALGTLSTIQIIEGIYLPTSIEVEYNGQTLKIPKAVEKQTDSNICVALLVDAIDDVYDKAILISGDSDLVPAVDEIRSRCPSKRITVATPPNRASVDHLVKAAHAHIKIGANTLHACQFPEVIHRQGQYPLTRPAEWK